ncbi:hypothetical protein [Treponema denticola]|nr:hypothetical protein [Treponema denticola]
MKNEDEKSMKKDSSDKTISRKTVGVCKAIKGFRRLLRGHITYLLK